jgi:hypothetical protein
VEWGKTSFQSNRLNNLQRFEVCVSSPKVHVLDLQLFLSANEILDLQVSLFHGPLLLGNSDESICVDA